MIKKPRFALLVALVMATVINLYYFMSYTDMTIVIPRTLFTDLLLVLTMVPAHESVRVKVEDISEFLSDRVKDAMKPVALYATTMALLTFLLLKIYGDAMIAQRLDEMNAMLISGKLSEKDIASKLHMAKSVYDHSSVILPMIVMFTSLFIGFASSVIAGLIIKK